MHTTNIGIFKIAQTRVNWPAVLEWLDFLGVKDSDSVARQIRTRSQNEQLDRLHTEVVATDASALIALCGKRCYNSFEPGLNPNVSKIRTDHAEYLTNVLKSGHGSIFEHSTWSFAIENVSRVFTAEMNRHRAGVSISEASMRYIRFDDIGFTEPDSVRPDQEANLEVDLDRHEQFKRIQTTRVFHEAFTQMEQWNIDLCNIWKIEEMTDFTKKKQLTSMFRRIIGMGVSTGGVWTLNARALRHIIALRGSIHAEEEIYHVFDRIAQIMIEDEPLLFGDFQKTEEGWVPKYPKV